MAKMKQFAFIVQTLVILIAIIENLLDRKRHIGPLRLFRFLMKNHKLPAVFIWKRAQQDAINHAEDLCVNSDPQGQSEHSHRRKPQILK